METKGLVALRISLASPETIRSWSYGEVLKPETINYRRLRPEKDGLFCEAIFGPARDWQCYCGKYKNPRYKGIICDKCGVEVTRAAVRRERMGHIDLATPVAHIWYTRRIPSYLGLLLDISRRNLDRVLYFAQYIVTFVDEEARNKALKRLEDEINVSEREVAGQINAKILEIKVSRDHKLNELQAQKTELQARADEQIAQRLEPVIQEGQHLERTLQDLQGKATRTAIVFSGTSIVIAEAGETISAQHITKVQRVVKERLEELESEFKAQMDRDLSQMDITKAQIKAEADEQMEGLRNQLEDQSAESQNQNSRMRDELHELKALTFISESRYRELKQRWGQVFRADMGAEAFYDILKRLELDQLSNDLWEEVRTSKSKQKRKKATTRLKIVEAFRRSGNRPEWMILTVLPVIPPDLRPMVQLDGGRFATSDLNDLYRRVINRNNRLKRLLELGAPDVIVRNEKRMLQEAVDSLVDNSQRGKALSRRGRRELKSLSDMLKGKKGRFRRNLLGKRVDYSGRSVIVVGPALKLYQCGLPKAMALELYRPFVISRLVAHNYAANVKGARRFIERNRPEVWEVLEEVIKDRPVLLNRAPTLHRLGIQAFEPTLIEGSAIQLHPLVTTAFNADFDGDQMAVHVPLSEKAVWEARNLMLSSRNLLKPADGEPIISPSKDMVLGVYYLTVLDNRPHKGDGRVFADSDEVELAYNLGQVDIHAHVKVRVMTHYDENGDYKTEAQPVLLETTVGRVLFNRILPSEVQFTNDVLDKGGVKDLIATVYELCGQDVTTEVADRVKDIGFEYAMRSGSTIAVADILIPPAKAEILGEAQREVENVTRSWRRGLLTEQERNERIIDIWQETTKKVGAAVRKNMDPNGNLAIMANSGATKGGFGPISQLAGMRGLMADPSGRIIRLPIQSNFREGLTALEYFISTHGARKGLADTALRTADAGYLTRRLVDVAQDVIINDYDCGTTDGVWIRRADDVAGQSFGTRLYGRLAAARIVDPLTGEVLAERDDVLDHELVRKIVAAGVDQVKARSPMTCSLTHGMCAKCYGLDLGRGKMVELGSAVGIVAAQSIGEPGTQLTLRTFHTGGVAAGGDITTGLPRVEELFEARRAPKGEAVITRIKGVARIIQSDRYTDQRVVRVEDSELASDVVEVPEGWTITARDESTVSMGDILATMGEALITAQHAGQVRIENQKVIVSYEVRESEEYDIPSTSRLLIKDGEHVSAGQALTEGSLNPHTILKINGREACQMYLMSEIQKVYRAQGQNINDKHFEVIIRKMLGKVQVTRPGDTPFLPMDLVDRLEIRRHNELAGTDGKQPAKFMEVLLGVTKASLSTDSFLSASSFQHTIKVLAGAAIASTEDPLFGLKENVIIGKLIPAGTGFVAGRFDDEEQAARRAMVANLPSSD
ncbi:DNA-directed RNA polymerase subunit beta' [Levilinea saccharolytica]|uniref:DNA-directed RNA polymerase subunit beta' n=1 Tax=Levilinea saccharolytica TaxID=229921 RepID=A0A0P6Z3L4_9CHLR|nr:DNA-directed RNA polymerase subunit beta' [Levilinea saccharolytica]KPL91843.1 DNA-directed RNA polymerase subunit beta' [Levilinea saccharolytica]GAP17667.1 DNA-directed RNA polymerase subunit beta [Levilinea saccharolytica]